MSHRSTSVSSRAAVPGGARPRRVRAALLALASSVLFAALLAPGRALAETGGSEAGAFQNALAHGTLTALLASYGFGLVTSLTPCVYPMIAITVSVFGAREASTRAHGALLSLTFVAGIVCLFTPLGVVSALAGRGFGSALGDLRVVAFIALVFLTLSASLFGAFELALPSSVNNRLSTVGGTGFGGAFLLGLVCGLVAAPCVGPFLFSLLGWIATTRNAVLGSLAMAAYGLGLGTLFFAVGAFAVNLPKAGAWMMGTKWLGGVALAYLALAYVRDALPREALRKIADPGVWYGALGLLLLAVGLALATVHVTAERRNSRIAHVSHPAKMGSIVPAVAGLWIVVTWWQIRAPELAWESSEPSALARAESEKRPLLVDFGATWCAACKELEHDTFPDPRVRAEGTRFVALHIDATNDDDPEVVRVRQKYGATAGLPVVLLLDSQGKEAFRFTEFVPPDRLADALAKVH